MYLSNSVLCQKTIIFSFRVEFGLFVVFFVVYVSIENAGIFLKQIVNES